MSQPKITEDEWMDPVNMSDQDLDDMVNMCQWMHGSTHAANREYVAALETERLGR